jgi:hypothetical protein
MLDLFKEWGACLQDVGNTKGVATISCIPIIFLNILSALMLFAGFTTLVMFIIGGFKFMNAAGDPKKIEGARNNFIAGIIGASIVLFSFAIIQIISTVTQVECITKFGFLVCQ